MPFVTVSCSGVVAAKVSGINLAAGTNIETKDPFGGQARVGHMESEPLSAVALGAAILGLLSAFLFKTQNLIKANLLFGIVGSASLFLLKSRLDSEAIKASGGLVHVNYEMSFWLSLILFSVTAAISIYFLLGSKKSELVST